MLIKDRLSFSWDISFASSFLLHMGQKSLLLLLCLWSVAVGKLKYLSIYLLVLGLGELTNGYRYSEPLTEKGLCHCSLMQRNHLKK